MQWNYIRNANIEHFDYDETLNQLEKISIKT